MAPKCHIPFVAEKVLGTKPRNWKNSRKANSVRLLKGGEEKPTRKEAWDKVLLFSVWHWHHFVSGNGAPWQGPGEAALRFLPIRHVSNLSPVSRTVLGEEVNQ